MRSRTQSPLAFQSVGKKNSARLPRSSVSSVGSVLPNRFTAEDTERAEITHRKALFRQIPFAAFCAAILIFAPSPSSAQVSPVELLNPRLKALEEAHLTKLMAMNRTIGLLTYPFEFSLNRYVGSDSSDAKGAKEKIAVDGRGLEFVNFHDQAVLKVTGNYNAAFDADQLTANQRASRVFNDVVFQILQVLPGYFSGADGFDGVGFEISYHVRRKAAHYEYEGKEFLVAVLSKRDALRYAKAPTDSERQEILNRSEIFLNGKAFGLSLGATEPFNVEALKRSVKQQPRNGATDGTAVSGDSVSGEASVQPAERVAIATQDDVARLEAKYKTQLDALAGTGLSKYHFVQYAPPSFVIFHNRLELQLTLRNPNSFEKDGTSIYKRAARSFDLFLAPQLKSIIEQVPDDAEINGLDITVLNDLTAPASHYSEALEFICPLKALRKFANADIANQDLINQSVVLVNGVRITLNLQQVE